jgi:hypothetical protein
MGRRQEQLDAMVSYGRAAVLWPAMPREWSSVPYKGSGLEGGSRTPMRRRSRGMGAWYDGDVRWCTTATPVDGRRHGRRGLAMAQAARGTMGVGKEGGAAQGDPTVRGSADHGQPRRAGPAEPRGGDARRRHASSSAELWRVASKFRFSAV